MERILLFCGVWIIIVPILFQNSYFEEHKKYTLSTQIIGFFAFLMGILHFFNIVKKGHYLDVVLFCVLFVWVGKLSYDKIVLFGLFGSTKTTLEISSEILL